MGVGGLKTFLERENQTFEINIGDEVEKWKRQRPNQSPLIAIDFLSMTHGTAKKADDIICGGRHKIALDSWKQILNALKASGCSLVFYSDLHLQESKIDTWLARRNGRFDFYASIYQLIGIGASLDMIVAAIAKETQALMTTFDGMEVIAHTYGEFHHAIKYECDVELAQYANQHNAMAIISDDTDFLIFEGSWKLWSCSDFKLSATNQATTTEYNRNGVANICSLSQYQLPLFATLAGNGFIKYEQLVGFHRSLGPMSDKIKNIAHFVRGFNSNPLSDSNIEGISQRVFGCSDSKTKLLIRQGIDSYKTNFPSPTIVDHLELKLLKTNMYRAYASHMYHIQGITMQYYDMQNPDSSISFPMLLTQWLKRRIGVLRNKSKHNPFTFTLLAKKDVDQFYVAHKETAIYPDFPIPSLDVLYLDQIKQTADIIGTKLKILCWIMSLKQEVVTKMKGLPKAYLLIGTILYALVKDKLITIEEADGILYTEKKVYENGIITVQYPTVLVAKFVRAAHLYNVTFAHVRDCFAISGLLSFVEGVLQFDGVFYQKLMEKVSKMNTAERQVFFEPIKKYRIYAEHF